MYDDVADYVFDIYCDQLGSILSYPDVRCKKKNNQIYKPVHLRLFSRYAELHPDEVTQPMFELKLAQ